MKNIIAELDQGTLVSAVWRGDGIVDIELDDDAPEPGIRKLHIRREKKAGDAAWKQVEKDAKTKIKALTSRSEKIGKKVKK